ncbi:MAG TPA: 1-deoxy-D-xylulose-5-phosphate reductoisomerase [Casimicrobiaceae bacterium]|nr:1-deoxy-D-xylulose-5-phosphate reductoisomerase [Casimicrobiaceae bacterium]
MTLRRVSLLGATGSIGASTLDVIARHPERFEVVALAANRDAETLAALCRRHAPRIAALRDPEAARLLARDLAAAGLRTEVLSGEAGLCAVATLPEADTVLAAIVGAAGLGPTLAAARAGKRILLANKEALVIGGAAFMAAVAAGGATLLPVDSEHNAIFQCLPPRDGRSPAAAGVRRILLTASGGPFRTRSPAELARVTPDEACAHPNWVMGRKISVDSATMMNKGLEVIEAHWLFGAPRETIEVVIHPESVIHSLVEYVDGSVLAQLGHPDMRTPIAQALAWPDRIAAGVSPLDLARHAPLTFEAPDPARFPCLALAYEALDAGGTAPAVLNAANEVAVAAFLAGHIRFTDIAPACADALARLPARPVSALDDALDADRDARAATRAFLLLPANSAATVA